MSVSETQTPVTGAEFRSLMSRFPSGVTVVSTLDEQGMPHGMTVSAFSSLSMQPPLVLVCIDASATMSDVISRASHFAVSILSEDQQELSRRFSDAAMEQRFAGVPIATGAGDVPILLGAHAVVQCRRVSVHAGGDHIILIGEVIGGSSGADTRPLLYHRGAYERLER